MKTKKWFFLIISLTIVGFFGFSSYQAIKISDETPATHYFNEWIKAPDEKRVNILKENNRLTFTDINDAAKSIKYSIKKPKNSLDRKILGVFLAEAPKGLDGQITILYENGLYIKQIPVDGAVPDYNKIVEQDIKDKEKGILMSDTVPVLLKIKGNSGYGMEPGYNDFGDKKEPRPGFVEWCENGVIYTVFGDNISLNELIKVGESMENIE